MLASVAPMDGARRTRHPHRQRRGLRSAGAWDNDHAREHPESEDRESRSPGSDPSAEREPT